MESIREQAEPYRLVTAKFPIDALTPTWSVGVNRPINSAHKRRLCEIFMEQGVLRKASANRLRLACDKEDVRKMLDHIQSGRERGRRDDPREQADAGGDEAGWPSFDEWITVTGKKAELMAGNHRVEALKELLQKSMLAGDERWWICDMYDKGARSRFGFPNPLDAPEADLGKT